MNDRELLEAAAKVAGVRYDHAASKPHPTSGAFWGLWLVFDDEPSEYAPRYWNPLTDDGDALRLAVKLRMNVEVWPDIVSVTTTHRATGDKDASEQAGSDLNAATRRAIVRVAAATLARLVGEA